MKIQFSLPTNEDFFNRYATLVPTLTKLGFIAQVISGLTEVGIIYSIIFSRVYEFTETYAGLIATIGAIAGTAFLEIGLRKFTPYSVQAFLYRRFSGLDLAMTIFILAVNVGLLFGSGTLSFQGSKELVSIAAPAPKLKTTDKADSQYYKKTNTLQLGFKSDSTTIVSGYQNQIEAKEKKYAALIAQQQTKLNTYQRKEQRTGKSYITKKETIKGKMAELEAEQAEQVAQLEATQANELKQLMKQRKEETATAERLYLANTGKIENENTNKIIRAEASTDFYGFGLAWFTIICLFVFVFSVIIGEIHKKGSGIEQVAIPNQYNFSQSVWADLTNMINEKLNYHTREFIKRFADTTPPPPLPEAPPSLYDLAQAKQQRLSFEVEEMEQQRYLLFNQTPEIDRNKAQLIDNHPAPNLNGKSKAKNLVTASAKVEATTNGKTLKENPIRKSYNDKSLNDFQRTCAHCNTVYVYRHHKQKYCSDGCRIKAWESRTGKELKLKKKK